MAAITTRQTGTTGTAGVTRKDAPLTNAEIDNNFVNLNNDKLDRTSNLSELTNTTTARTNLGLGSLAVLSSISDTNWSGTDLAVANGGTGASNAADARTNLGAQAADSDLTAIAGLSGTGIIVRTGDGTANTRTITSGDTTYIEVTNANGVSGNPSINVGSNIAKLNVDSTWTSTGFIDIPAGTTAQRPASLSAGQIRFNTSSNNFEGYDGTSWRVLTTVGGDGSNPIMFENDSTITVSYSIRSGRNAISAGPITIANNITITVPNGSSWAII